MYFTYKSCLDQTYVKVRDSHIGMGTSNRRGKRGEDYFKFAKGLTSDEPVERTGIGSDFKVGDDYYEVKTGEHARKSRRQKREEEERGDNYHEVRYDENIDYGDEPW